MDQDAQISGDDLEENMERDYQRVEELDRYEQEGIDDEGNHQELDPETRAMLDKRDRDGMAEDSDSYDEDAMARRMRRERGEAHGEEGEEDAREEMMEEMRGGSAINEWLKEKRTIQFVRNAFGKFLRNFKDERGYDVYEERISEMCTNNKQSLDVTYSHITVQMPTLAIWIAEAPAAVLPILNQVAFELVTEVFPQYEQIFKEVFVRIRDLPLEDKLRDLRHVHLRQLIKVKGVVTKRS